MSALPSPERIAELRKVANGLFVHAASKAFHEMLNCIESLVKERDELRGALLMAEKALTWNGHDKNCPIHQTHNVHTCNCVTNDALALIRKVSKA